MTPTTKQEREKDKAAAQAARTDRPRTNQEAREDAEASRQDRPSTTEPAQKERWENEGGQPGGVISSTDATKPEKEED